MATRVKNSAKAYGNRGLGVKTKMNGQNRKDIKIGGKVKIALNADQRTGKLTEGIVAKILTKISFHPRGIKVMLDDGQVGRVQEVISD